MTEHADRGTAIATLMAEHRTIERALDRLEALATACGADRDDARAELATLAAFFAEFADHHHHGKEEAVLFELMVEAGLPRDVGPIACMLEEHASGRALVRRLRALGAGEGPLGARDQGELAEVGASFCELLRAHIQKEDRVLYPMALRALDAAALAELDARCAAMEAACVAAGARARLDQLVAATT
jgi:hemerythrin-like domain-containing protein